MAPSRMGRHHAEMVRVVEGDEKEGRERKIEELHQHKVAQMVERAEGSAALVHKISKPTARRGGAQILKKEEEDAKLLDRCEAKMKDWAKHLAVR